MAHLEVNIHDTTMGIRSQAFCAEFQKRKEKEKALFVFLRRLRCSQLQRSIVSLVRRIRMNAWGRRPFGPT